MIREIRRGRSFLVTTHFSPDADAIGSALALAIALKRLRKKVKVYNRDPVPRNLSFLPGASNVTDRLGREERFDATLLVDCAGLDRVGEGFAEHPGLGTRIVIDHHRRGRRGGEIHLIDEEAVSTGVVVLELLRKMRVKVDRDVGLCIYATIVGDTGSFQYSNTDWTVFALARDLASLGVDPWFVSKNLFENFPKERLFLLGRMLQTLEISPDGRIASIVLTNEMLAETGATVDLAEDFINLPRSIDTVEVALQFREVESGFKVSLRSKDRVDVSRLASFYGGGGHERAAGCVVSLGLAEAKREILRRVEEALASR